MAITITEADDWHIHLRDGEMLARTVPDCATQFARALIMPNLPTPVASVGDALAYHKRILAHAGGRPFTPVMSLYLTDRTTPDTIWEAKQSGIVKACKLYPQGCTTNSQHGVLDLSALDPVFAAMSEAGILLLVHGETTNPAVDVFDREQVFIDEQLIPLRKRHPKLKIVLEHISTEEGIMFVETSGPMTAGTITPHHLLLNRNDLFKGGIRPHHYCLPILKRQTHQAALLKAATSGNPQFFAGTDSAPHAQHTKEHACGCAGVYTAPFALNLYAEAFSRLDKLNKLEAFVSFYGADFYDLPRNTRKMELINAPYSVPDVLPYGNAKLVPLFANTTLPWTITRDA